MNQSTLRKPAQPHKPKELCPNLEILKWFIGLLQILKQFGYNFGNFASFYDRAFY